jgi:hypothetical protein
MNHNAGPIRPALSEHLNPGALIDDGNRLLADRVQASLLQLVRQGRFVGRCWLCNRLYLSAQDAAAVDAGTL